MSKHIQSPKILPPEIFHHCKKHMANDPSKNQKVKAQIIWIERLLEETIS